MMSVDTASLLLAHGCSPLDDIKHTGHVLTMRLLKTPDLPQVMRLQETINAELASRHQQEFIVSRSAERFAACMQEQGVMVGVFDRDTLVAQTVVAMPPAYDSDHGCDLEPDGSPEQLVVLGGILVDPAYRGNHLMQRMGEVGVSVGRVRGRRYVLSEAMVNNPYSWRVMLDLGLNITACDVAPSDGAQLYLAQRDLKHEYVLPDTVEVYLNPMLSWKVQRGMFADDQYVGWKYHDGRLGLSHRR